MQEETLISQGLRRKGVDRNPNYREEFNTVIYLLNLIDLPIKVWLFTWSNMREHSLMARLDRILVSDRWDTKSSIA